MPAERASEEQLDAFRLMIDAWAGRALADNPLLVAVDRDPDVDRWYLRMQGDDKATFTIWLTLRERTLHFESYFMPAPEEHVERCYEYLLRASAKLFAWRFAVGLEDAVYLVGQLPLSAVDDDELDRVMGSGWAYTEAHFRSAMSIGFASRYRPPAA
ncbi:MAG TPA: YbjN domain-containing protein [Acidimicrobiales bacterium]|nr:YbjN domain-containing protein [Acidimicrobiales bacterium]